MRFHPRCSPSLACAATTHKRRPRMRGRLLFGGLLAGLIAFSPPDPSPAEKGQARVAEQPEAARKVPAELVALNSASRRMYASARTQELSAIPVVIVVSGDDLIMHL